MILFWT